MSEMSCRLASKLSFIYWRMCVTFCPNPLCLGSLFFLPVGKNQMLSIKIPQPCLAWEGLLYFFLFLGFHNVYNGIFRVYGIQETEANTSVWRRNSKYITCSCAYSEVSSFFWYPQVSYYYWKRHNHSLWTPSLTVMPAFMEFWLVQVTYFSLRFTLSFSQTRNQIVNFLQECLSSSSDHFWYSSSHT